MNPLKVPLSDLNAELDGDIDVFLCSVSFEDRCRSVADSIDPCRVGHVLIAENENHIDLHGDNAGYLQGRFSSRFDPVMLDTSKPLKTADSLEAALRKWVGDKHKRVVVDITTFTREALLILFRLLHDRFPQADVRYVYARAAEFDPGAPKEEKWLSKGVEEVRSVLGYPGELLPSRRLHLIVLVGLEHERATELIRAYEPSMISLGYAQQAEGDLDPDKLGFNRVSAVFGAADRFTFERHDPLHVKAVIEERVASHKDSNVVIAPMNTKASTLGAALVAMDNPEVQLCYAQASVYNYRNYSKPGDHAYVLRLPNVPPVR